MTPTRPARKDELAAAFALLFARLPPPERAYRAAKALELAASGELDARGVLVAPGDGGPVGVFVCQPVAGAGGLVWPPVVMGGVEAVEDRLVRDGCAWLRSCGARLAQCLLAEDEAPLGPSLLRNGFREVTGLTYLRHDLRGAWGEAEGLTFEGYDEARPGEFHDALLRTYEATLDCPEVNGVRSVEEVIHGHQSQGSYDPSRWWLARRGGAAVGVVLVVEPAAGEWEVAYMGVVPEARRRGVGRGMLGRALREARAAGACRVVLSVDDRNAPARGLYERAGFVAVDHRRVLLAVW